MTKSERTVADRLRRFRKDELIEMLVELDRRGRYTTVDRVLTDREIAKSEACQARAEEETQNSIACLEAYKHAFERFQDAGLDMEKRAEAAASAVAWAEQSEQHQRAADIWWERANDWLNR